MAYPQVVKPYGFKPINLIGGQPYAGSTRMFKIASGYNTNIFYGDPVKILRSTTGITAPDFGGELGDPVDGSVVLVNTSVAGYGTGDPDIAPGNPGEYKFIYSGPYTIGVFMGCSFTNPYTKQKMFSQYYPAGTVADDIQAYVVDDPDALFKVVYVADSYTPPAGEINFIWAEGLTPDYVGLEYIGRNLIVAVNPGDTNTGNSLYGVTDNAIYLANYTSMFPVRVVDVVPETATSDGFCELIVKWNMPGRAGTSEGSVDTWFGGHEYYWPGTTRPSI